MNSFKMLAIDLGASSGRVMKVVYTCSKLEIKEIHRFKNFYNKINNNYYWDHQYIFAEIKKGINKDTDFHSIGVDTWGVDYVIYNGDFIDKSFCYRDNRSTKYFEKSNKEEMYFLTGTAMLSFNTVFQLMAEKNSGTFMMLPDYYTFLLTDKITNEYSNMKTTQLLNYKNNKIIKSLANDKIIFNEITKLKIFDYKDDKTKKVVQVASHDTASAFIGSPFYDEAIIISFGTWSIVGAITSSPIVSKESFKSNFSNEGSVFNDNRFVKNTMGSWIYEKILSEHDFDGDYTNLIKNIEKSQYSEIIDIDNTMFLNPENMTNAINEYIKNNNLKMYKNVYDIVKAIFNSIVKKYVEIINEIEHLTNKKYKYVNIIGGGSKNSYLVNNLKNEINKKLYVGPSEATVVGNSICQLIANEKITKKDMREIILNSNLVKEVK